MIKVAHRGNIQGRNIRLENDPAYINSAISMGYCAEVDVWYKDGNFYLGHDEPSYLVGESFLENGKLFCHAKNIEALHIMLENPYIHCFWHEGDLCTLTSQGFIWQYPEVYFAGKLWGVCSDWL
tara:strand:+ start:2498 stop:2869 length:372 start_codon:yes stop_codon:yes gene_type:complete